MDKTNLSTDEIDQNVKIIELYNGSIIQLVGSNNVDALIGTNPFGIFIRSEENVYPYIKNQIETSSVDSSQET